jgi:hypothetical protein
MHHSAMIRARIPISRTAEGLWKAEPSSVDLGPDTRIPITATPPEETLADLVETVMGEALLCLDKHGRRGTSEAIEWEIVVDHVPYCYRCIEPMQPPSPPLSAPAGSPSEEWKCAECGTVIHFG